MAKRSPSGIHLPIIDQRYDQKPTLTLLSGGSVTLVRDEMQYIIAKSAAVLAVSTTIVLPPDPQDGDEVVIASSLVSLGVGQNLVIDGNGRFIGLIGPFANSAVFTWVKYSLEEDVWIPLNCCMSGEV